jgi:hypothetical protein
MDGRKKEPEILPLYYYVENSMHHSIHNIEVEMCMPFWALAHNKFDLALFFVKQYIKIVYFNHGHWYR